MLSFVQRGLAAAVIIGAVCSFVGVFVVLRGMSYIGAGIAHGSLAGVALAFLLGLNPLFMSILAALTMVIFVELVKSQANLRMDSSIGVVFSLALALAVLFIGLLKTYTTDIMSYLFGSLLRVSADDLRVIAIIGVLVVAAILLVFKEIKYSTFDPEMARLAGISPRFISLFLSVLMGLTIVISLQAVGELLVLALIVLPASTAYQLTKSLGKMLLISVCLGVAASVLGLIAAFYLDAPAGATIVILLGLIFFLAVGIKRRPLPKAGGRAIR